jgi:hypothetical protein
MVVRLIAAVLLLLISEVSYLSADVYRWTDAQGHVHYGNQPPSDARDAKLMFKESAGPSPGQANGEDQRSTEAALQELEDEQRREAEARKEAESVRRNSPPDRAELIAREKGKLERKIQELEEAPLDQFGSQKNKRVRIGYYQYRLETLMTNPDEYFNNPEPFEGNLKLPEKQ